MEWTRHAFDKIIMLIEGRAEVVLGAEDPPHPLQPMQPAVIPAGTRHRLRDLEPVSLYALCLDARFREPFVEWARIAGSGRVFQSRSPDPELGTLFRQLLFEQVMQPTGWTLASTRLALELMTWLVRAGSRPSTTTDPRERVRRYIRDLEATFFTEDDLDAVAARLGMSRRRFTSLFREQTGESWLQAQRRLRIDHACRLLGQTQRSIPAVAFESGFRDLAHFYRTFKQHTGKSPGQWRGDSNDRK